MKWLKKRLGNSLEHFRTFRRLRAYTRRENDSDFKKMVGIQMAGVALHASSPFFWGQVVTYLHSLSFDLAGFWLLASGGLKLVVEMLNYFRRVIRDRCQSKLRLYIGETFYEKFFSKSVGEHVREGTHLTSEYMRKGEQNALSMEDTVLVEGYAIFIEFASVSLFLCVLSPFAGLAMLGIVALNLVWNLFINHKVFSEYSPIERKWREMGSFIEERIDKVVYIKNNAQEENTLRLFREKFRETFQRDHAFWKWHFKSIRTRDLMNLILWMLVLWYGFEKTKSGGLPVGAFLTMLLWTQSIMDKVWRMTEMEARLCRHMAIVKQALDELERPPMMIESGKLMPVRGVETIQFLNISFEYLGGLHTIRNFSLDVKRGDRVALIGPSGAGKTTLMSLLLRHSDPTEGEILVDGISLKELSLLSWRRLVGIIPQQVDLLDGTILDNIAFGLPEGIQDRNRLLEAADSCQILEFGERLTHGLETRIGEDGIQLSGGQRQRVAWATAIAKDPSVLIIDEGTSNLDALTEEQLVQNLDKFCKSRISFIIAHRLATIKTCNLFVVLKPIKNCAQGEHQIETVARSFEECKNKSPLFSSMLKQQELNYT